MATIPSAGQALIVGANGVGYLGSIVNKKSNGEFQLTLGNNLSLIAKAEQDNHGNPTGNLIAVPSSDSSYPTWFTKLPNENAVAAQLAPNSNPTLKFAASFGS